MFSQPAFTCSKSTIETLKLFTPSSSVSIVNFEHVIAGWVIVLTVEMKLTSYQLIHLKEPLAYFDNQE